MRKEQAIEVFPELARLCVNFENARRLNLVELKSYLARRNFVPCSDLKAEIAAAMKDSDRAYQLLSKQAKSIRFASRDDLQKWLKRLESALHLIEKRS